MDKIMKEIISQMKLVYDLMSSDDFAKAIAKMYKNLFDALMKEGFTSNEAMELLTHMDLGYKK